jgi:site-specific recombinase XerD
MQYLAAQRMSGVTRVRKLAAIRKFFAFMEENMILQAVMSCDNRSGLEGIDKRCRVV